VSQGEKVAVSVTHEWQSLQGVNDKEQLPPVYCSIK